MGKKRNFPPTHKINVQASSSRSSASATQQASVAEKLSKLRIESLNQQRNRLTHDDGLPQSSLSTSMISTALHGDPEISHLLGLESTQPAARVKASVRGHMVPKSWLRPPKRACGADQAASIDCLQSLADTCLLYVLAHIHDYTACNLHYLPGHLKQKILSAPIASDVDNVWQALLPESDSSIDTIDVSLVSLPVKRLNRYLLRMPELRCASVSTIQLIYGMVSGLSAVLQELTIHNVRNDGQQVAPSEIVTSTWRSLSRHLVALRLLKIVGQTIDELLPELRSLGSACDWSGSWRTVSEIHVVTKNNQSCTNELIEAANTIRARRSPGHYLEITLTNLYDNQVASIPYKQR